MLLLFKISIDINGTGRASQEVCIVTCCLKTDVAR